MVGQHLRYLRQRQGIALTELAQRAGLTDEALRHIEDHEAVHVPTAQLLRLASGLQLRRAGEFVQLVQLSGARRRFRLYVTGLPKTGSVSLCGVFANYRNAHEFRQWDTHQAVIAFRQGRLNRDELRGFLLERDAAANAELDAAHFHRHYLDLLAEEFPEARFVCLIRDPFSWVSSFINHILRSEGEALQSQQLPNGLPFDLPSGSKEAREELVGNFSSYAETPIAFWAGENRAMLAKLPPGRSMILRTHEIGQRLDELARFASVPLDSLHPNQSHLNRASYRIQILHHCERKTLQTIFERHCADLLAEYFPEFTLDDYLKGSHPPILDHPTIQL